VKICFQTYKLIATYWSCGAQNKWGHFKYFKVINQKLFQNKHQSTFSSKRLTMLCLALWGFSLL
jgi:hypothetical protein